MSTKDKARIGVDVIFDEQTLFRNCSNLLIREKSNYVRQQSFRILEEKAQRDVVDQIDETGAYPSHAQTYAQSFEQGKRNYEMVREIMKEENRIKNLSINFHMKNISLHFPKTA